MPAMEPITQAEPHPAPAPAAPARTDAGGNVGGLLRRIGLAFILLAAILLGYFKFQSNKREADDKTAQTFAQAHHPTPVSVAPVVARTMPVYLTALGTVTAYNTVTVKSRVDGQLLSVNVREGQQIHKGQLLAVIDPRPYEATLAQAKGQLAKDQAASDYARAEASRYTALYDAGVVSKESQQTQISTAGQTAGSIAADQAAIEAAQVNVAYTRIASPIDGVVGLRQVDAGNIVHAADTNGLLVVTQLQPISVIFTLPEDQIPEVLKRVRAGQKLTVEAYDRADSSHLATGSLLTVDNEIDPTTGTVKAKAVFPNSDNALFPNQFVNVRLVLEERPGALVIPTAAIQTGSNGAFVYRLREGKPPHKTDDEENENSQKTPAELKAQAEADAADHGPKYYVDVQNVSVDLTEGPQAILRSGLTPGDLIVVDGQEKLKRFSKVSPRQGLPAAAARSASSTASPLTPPATVAQHTLQNGGGR